MVGSDPTDLIVVGNGGLGVEAGEVLGNIPREMVRNTVCDVMVVQTGDEQGRASTHSPRPPG